MMDSNSSPQSVAKTESASAGSAQREASESDEADDAKDEPSTNENNLYSELDDFRRIWQHEIEVSPVRERSYESKKVRRQTDDRASGSGERDNDVPQKVEEQARALFLAGVQAERTGLLERAISFYRRAVQLVPDIEFRVTEYSNDNTNSNSFSDDSDDSSDKENIPYDEVSDSDSSNLVEKFQRTSSLEVTGICQPNVEQKGTHISALPTEILMYILKWVVSTDLDLLSLEQVSKVCRGFYLCARDSEIWRLACLRIWEVNIGSPNKYGSWRNMFIQRPHLLYNGAYISKTTYIRYGEPSFQDTNYRPCYLVAYFRYLRFFPDGLVLMLTTPDDPYQSLFKLRYKKPKHQSIHFGRYKMVGTTVVAVVKQPKRETATLNYYRYRRPLQANVQEPADQTFHLELEMKSVKRRANCQLTWKRYSIHVIHKNGQESVSDFELTPSNFPPFWFSRVKSYASETESPLK